jgi:hypothetical protein
VHELRGLGLVITVRQERPGSYRYTLHPNAASDRLLRNIREQAESAAPGGGVPMSWAKADDRYDDTAKIKRAWRLSGYAVGLHWMAVTSCARHESDGLIDPEWLAERLGVIPKRAAETALSTLVTLGLFEELPAGERKTVRDRSGVPVQLGPLGETAYIVHDYLQYQDSASTLEAKRADERLRKAISARAKELGMTVQDYRKTDGFRKDFPPDSERKTPGIHAASGHPDPTRPDPTRPDLGFPPPAPPNKFGGEPGIAGDSSRGKPNPRATGTNPRAIGRQHVQAVSANAAAVLDSPNDEERRAWEQLHALLARSVEGGAGAVHVMDAYLAGVDGGVFVIDAPTTAWAWLVARADRALPACCDRCSGSASGRGLRRTRSMRACSGWRHERDGCFERSSLSG